jgi:hypothetical protein
MAEDTPGENGVKLWQDIARQLATAMETTNFAKANPRGVDWYEALDRYRREVGQGILFEDAS